MQPIFSKEKVTNKRKLRISVKMTDRYVILSVFDGLALKLHHVSVEAGR